MVIIWVLIEVPDPRVPFEIVQYDLWHHTAVGKETFKNIHLSANGASCMEIYDILNDENM